MFLDIPAGSSLYGALSLYVAELDLIIAQSIYNKMQQISLDVTITKKTSKKKVVEASKTEVETLFTIDPVV